MTVSALSRVEKLRARLRERDLDAFFCLQPENRRYLSGFTGTTGMVVVTAGGAHFLTDFRYVEQAERQAQGFTVHRVQEQNAYTQVLGEILRREGARRVGFESDFLTVDGHARYAKELEGVELVPAAGMVEAIRQVKEPDEIEAIRRAAALADAAFEHVLTFLRPGVTEREVALELEFFMKRNGATALAFDTIVASGPRSSLPHGVASDRVIGRGELVTLDFGCVVDGYCSDMTRTVAVGEPDEKQREIYRIVLEAQARGLEAARPGVPGKDVDAACRDYIAARGYGDNFGHTTGHGVGLAVHEGPRLSSKAEEALVPGNVVTVEPGIYLPGWGGVRIEDLVVITENGCEILSRSPKALTVLE